MGWQNQSIFISSWTNQILYKSNQEMPLRRVDLKKEPDEIIDSYINYLSQVKTNGELSSEQKQDIKQVSGQNLEQLNQIFMRYL